MKKIINTLEFAAIMLLLAGVVSCEKENGQENLYRENIIGKWKLMYFLSRNSDDFLQFDTINYSHENIIYDFRSNNKLIITGYVEDDFAEGEHTYNYVQMMKPCPTCDPSPNLVIDDVNHFYCESFKGSNKMNIGVANAASYKEFIKLN
jgi:hypothetical protein